MKTKLTFFTFFIIYYSITYSQTEVAPFSIKPTKADWESGYLNRVTELDNGYDWNNHSSDTDDGKRYWPTLLDDLKRAEGDATALQNLIEGRGADGINSTWAGSFYKPFSCPGYIMYYLKYKDVLPANQKTIIETKWDNSGRNYTSRDDHKMDPIYSCTEFNSENFNWMARLGGYLMAEDFNDQTLIDGVPAIDWYTDYVKNWVRGTYAAGRVEWNSHVYTGFCFQAAMVVYEHAKNHEIRKMARAVMDWIVLENALHYLDGNLVGPDSRDKGNGYKDFTGSVCGYNYIYFADDDFHPSLSTNHIDNNFPGKWSIGFIMQSTYRPPQAIIDIAQRKFDMPVEMHNAKPFYWLDEDNYAHWKGNTSEGRRFEFEFQYMDDNYLLASVASGRPSGDIGHFSEQSVWKLGVVGSDTSGACVLFGNSNNDSDGAGRDENEQIGQYRNVQMRVIKGSNNMWTSIPDEKSAEISGDKVFANLDNDVYVALIPYNSSGVTSTNDSKDDSYTRYNWAFNSSELGALIMEVGTKKEHGSYANFKSEIINSTTLTSPATDQVEYISTSGKSLKVQKMPNEPWAHYCGGTYSNGGTYPKVWTDGEYVDFNTWELYEVVYGNKIVDMKWGGSQALIESNDNKLRITVDPITAQCKWEEWNNEGNISISGTVTNSGCSGAANGAIDLDVSGDNPDFSYLWSNGSTSQNISNISKGIYSVTVTDVALYTAVKSFNVPENSITVTGNTTNVSVQGGSDGAIDITTAEGTSPITYSWSNGSTSEDISNIPAGAYSVTVEDKEGCTASQIFNIQDGIVADLIIDYSENAPAIDGIIESNWNTFTSHYLNNLLLGNDNDISAYFKTIWDEVNLYILIEVTDDNLSTSGTSWYQDDIAEIYIDIGNDKATSYGSDDYQFYYGYSMGSIEETKQSATTNVDYAQTTDASGYVMEISMPWSTLQENSPEQGTALGIDIHCIDNDGGDTRVGKIAWEATSDNSWENPSLFANAVLRKNFQTNKAYSSVEKQIRFWPNPATDVIKFSNSINKIDIYDMQGRHICNKLNANKINIKDISKGIYILKMDDYITKIVIR